LKGGVAEPGVISRELNPGNRGKDPEKILHGGNPSLGMERFHPDDLPGKSRGFPSFDPLLGKNLPVIVVQPGEKK